MKDNLVKGTIRQQIWASLLTGIRTIVRLSWGD